MKSYKNHIKSYEKHIKSYENHKKSYEKPYVIGRRSVQLGGRGRVDLVIPMEGPPLLRKGSRRQHEAILAP